MAPKFKLGSMVIIGICFGLGFTFPTIDAMSRGGGGEYSQSLRCMDKQCRSPSKGVQCEPNYKQTGTKCCPEWKCPDGQTIYGEQMISPIGSYWVSSFRSNGPRRGMFDPPPVQTRGSFPEGNQRPQFGPSGNLSPGSGWFRPSPGVVQSQEYLGWGNQRPRYGPSGNLGSGRGDPSPGVVQSQESFGGWHQKPRYGSSGNFIWDP